MLLPQHTCRRRYTLAARHLLHSSIGFIHSLPDFFGKILGRTAIPYSIPKLPRTLSRARSRAGTGSGSRRLPVTTRNTSLTLCQHPLELLGQRRRWPHQPPDGPSSRWRSVAGRAAQRRRVCVPRHWVGLAALWGRHRVVGAELRHMLGRSDVRLSQLLLLCLLLLLLLHRGELRDQ